MKSRLRMFAPTLIGLILLSAGTAFSNAEISKGGLRARLVHSFMIDIHSYRPRIYLKCHDPDTSENAAASTISAPRSLRSRLQSPIPESFIR
jgi:hypothetical protein